MNWTEVTIDSATEGLDALCALLTDIGCKGFSIHDPNDFDDLMAGKVGHWDYLEEGLEHALTAGVPSVTVYLPENAQGAEQMLALRALLQQLRTGECAEQFGTLAIHCKGVREEDWANAWKQYFQPFCVGARLWVSPTWVDAPVPAGRQPLSIDPGSSFGTGQHDTTRLCLAMLDSCVRADSRVLDMGCGSGILSIGAMLLGAREACAVDIEQNAVESAAINAQRNGIDLANYHTHCGDILTDDALVQTIGSGYDLICANIVADILIAMCPLFMRFLKADGVLMLSGIIEERLADVQQGMTAGGFSVRDVQTSGGWVAMRLHKK